jgi:hypothetical protein
MSQNSLFLSMGVVVSFSLTCAHAEESVPVRMVHMEDGTAERTLATIEARSESNVILRAIRPAEVIVHPKDLSRQLHLQMMIFNPTHFDVFVRKRMDIVSFRIQRRGKAKSMYRDSSRMIGFGDKSSERFTMLRGGIPHHTGKNSENLDGYFGLSESLLKGHEKGDEFDVTMRFRVHAFKLPSERVETIEFEVSFALSLRD